MYNNRCFKFFFLKDAGDEESVISRERELIYFGPRWKAENCRILVVHDGERSVLALCCVYKVLRGEDSFKNTTN